MTLIRANHRYAFRSGKWARLVGIKEAYGRQCYEVRFPDGQDDLWVISDRNHQYEFKEFGQQQYKLAVFTRIDGQTSQMIGQEYAA